METGSKRVNETPAPALAEEVLIEMLAPQPGERIIDAGCGLGRWSAALACAGARVTGVDLHAPLLEQARYVCPAGVFLAEDLLTWRPAEPYDAIYAFATLHWIRPPLDAARALHAMLRPGGRLAVAFGGLSSSAMELEACYQPAPREYRRVLKRAGFAMLEERELERHFLMLAAR
jgi:trans-aconitate methyltransferase